MKLAAAGEAAVTPTVQCDIERPLQGVFPHLGKSLLIRWQESMPCS
jgi:hypothetical protein